MKFIYKAKGKNPMKSLLNIGVAFISLGALSGCNMYMPSMITENRVQVSEEKVTHDVLVMDIDDKFMGSLARHYTKHSGSPMNVVVTYDPKSRSNTAMQASNKASSIVGVLHDYGVTDINASILPIKSQGSLSHLLVSYNSFNAHAPKGCDVVMPGMDGYIESDKDYKLGCSTKTMIARQVAKPSHLLGRGATGDATSGRSATNIVDGYLSGAQNDQLEGLSASDE